MYCYLKIVYSTSKIQFIFPKNYNQQNFCQEKGVIFALWHNNLALGPRIFQGVQNVNALVSPHSDGKIISNIIRKFHFNIIEGSTNKNAARAVRQMIQILKNNHNVVITPDGPRGPIYQINSNIIKIAQKHAIKLIPISCNVSNYYSLSTWDNLIMPLPFCTIIIKIGNAVNLTQEESENNNFLITQLHYNKAYNK